MRQQGSSASSSNKLTFNSSTKRTSAWLSVRLLVGILAFLLALTITGNLSVMFFHNDSHISSSKISVGELHKQSWSTGGVHNKQQTINSNNVEQKEQGQNEPEGAEILEEEDIEEDTTSFDDSTVPKAPTPPPVSLKEGQEIIIAIFKDAGISLTNATLASLPSWNNVVAQIGEAPKIYGLDRCEKYRLAVPAVDRNVGCCGMFNSGTNLVTRLLKENCKIPERIDHYGWNGTFEKWGMGPADSHGMRWQVPWGKHTAAKYREVHATKKADNIDKDSLLPIVTIRNPYVWMSSMCKNGYTTKWQHSSRKCPHLVNNAKSMKPTNLTVKYGDFEDVFDSLAHLWNGWYQQYWKDAAYPFLMVRFEDLIFHARNVTTQICHCAGGVIRTDRPFFHIVKSAKDGPGHGKKEDRTDMVTAWIKYGNPLPVRGDFSKVDYKAARKFLNGELMQLFGYQHPRAA